MRSLIEAWGRGRFEVHLTTRPDSDPASVAARHGLKATHIELDRGEHPRQPMLTYHASGSAREAIAGAHAVAGRLAADGLAVVRIKVEADAADPHLPQSDREDPEGYFEGHLRVVVGTRVEELRELAVRYGAHLSRTPAKISGPCRRFVTRRVHDAGAPTALRLFARLRTAVEAAGFDIDKDEREYVLYDTRLGLDAGWLPCGPAPGPASRPSSGLSAPSATMPA